jgi:uncharacterized protein
MTKIILDTSVIVAHLISRSSGVSDIINHAKNGYIELYISPLILKELKNTIQKPKIKQYLGNYTARFIAQYQYLCTIVEPNCVIEICRDSTDNKFLEVAKTINAEYIITGDKDLLELKQFENTKIVNVNEFWNNN